MKSLIPLFIHTCIDVYYIEATTRLNVMIGPTFDGVTYDSGTFTVCDTDVTNIDFNERLYVRCHPPTEGRYVAVEFLGNIQLALCEVEVYETDGWCYTCT